MPDTIVNPAGLHDPVPFGYSHTATVPASAELVLVAGRYGSGPDGTVVSNDFAEQVRRAFHNLGVALGTHGLDLTDVVQLRTYVVGLDGGKLGAIAEAVRDARGTTPPPRPSSASPVSRCPTSCSRSRRSRPGDSVTTGTSRLVGEWWR